MFNRSSVLIDFMFRILFFFIGLLFFSSPLYAQNIVTVTNETPDESNGSFGWAVTTLNASGSAGAITFTQNVTEPLLQTLPPITQAVTFQGGTLYIVGETEGESQQLFQQAFIQLNGFDIQNVSILPGQLDASVTAASWAVSSVANTTVQANSVASTQVTGGIGFAGDNGGNATVSVGGDWTQGNNTQILAGAGQSVTSTGGTGDTGGAGGSAWVTAASIETSFSTELTGGAGGSVTDLSGGTNRGGAGGSAYLAAGLVSIGNFSTVNLSGGLGGSGVTGGVGGGATLLANSVSIVYSLSVNAGSGGQGIATGGTGGSAFVSFGSLVQSAQDFNLNIIAGTGGNSFSNTGKGGSAVVEGGNLSVTGNSGLEVTGGVGGTNATGSTGAVNGGTGGDASVSLGSLSDSSSAFVTVAGGRGGAGSSGAVAGAGGDGGNTSFSLGNFSINGTDLVALRAGSGGAGGSSTTSGTGGAGGGAGSLSVTLGTITLTTGSGLTIVGGNGGNGGNSTGGMGGNGGNGGSTDLAIGSVTLSTGNLLSVAGGAGGTGGNGAALGANGNEGTVSVNIGDLEGGGAVSVFGAGAQLVLSSGTFFGTLQGNGALEKVGSAALTLQGANNYSGNTYVTDGILLVDTGGALGTGTITNLSVLDYIHSASAENSSIVNDLTLNFMGNSSAGSATITTNNIGLPSHLYFQANSTGGTAELITNSGCFTDFSYSNASTVAGGAMTVGSIAGAGTYDLGRVDLVTGGNNSSTTVTGLITDGGGNGGSLASLTKVGTGTLTLASANAYTGGTQVQSGALAVGNSNALGSGSVLVSGGTLETLGPIAFSVGGSYRQSGAGNLQMSVGGAGASTSDHMLVAGNCSLDGTLNLTAGAGLTAPALGSQLTLVTGSSVSGIFQEVNENLVGARFLPLYFSNAVALESINPSFQGSGATPNQKAIGADLDTLALKPQMSGLMQLIGILPNNSLQAAYGQMTPEDFTAIYQVGFEGALARTALVDQRLSQVMADVDNTAWLPGFSSSGTPWFAGNLPAATEAAMAPTPSSPWGGFVSGDGGFFNVAGDSNAAGYKVSTFGLTGAGADYRFSREMTAGLLVGYGHTDVTLGTGGTLRADGGQLGLYGLFYSEGFYAGALVEGGVNSYSTQRLSYNGTATGTTQGSQWDGALELGYQFKAGRVKVGPMALMQYSSVGMNGFTEGGSQTPLTIPTQSENSLLSRLGMRMGSQWALGQDAALNPSLQLAWEHEYNYQGGAYQAGFGAGDSFTVAGPQVGQDGLAAEAGMGLTFAKSLTVFLDYQGEFGRTNLNSNQFGGGVRVGF